MKVLEKIIVAVLSSIILSLALAFLMYTPVAEQQSGVGYSYFKSLIILYLNYSLPVYLIGGGLYSAFIDVYIGQIQFRNKFIKYIVGLFVYGVGGLLIIGLIFLFDSNHSLLDILKVLIFGLLAALLFFHVSIILKKAFGFLDEN